MLVPAPLVYTVVAMGTGCPVCRADIHNGDAGVDLLH